MAAQIGVIGDLHSAWDAQDVAHFNGASYSLLLFTGDLGASSKRDGRQIAQSISRLQRPVLVMPGNNDVEQVDTLGAELTLRRGARSLLDGDDGRGPGAQLCGYSSHPFELPGAELTVVAGRPFSFGGSKLWFPEVLEREFGVTSLRQSAERIVSLVHDAPTRDVIILSHNGPRGLGAAPEAPWGNDFSSPGGDWGDPDLGEALTEIGAAGNKRLLAVIGGHMHWPIRDGAPRRFREHRDGTLYLNPARVPRIFPRPGGARGRHHFALSIDHRGARAEERVVETD
ncbi:MAG: metallophosphoesterase [Myxococcales bacterium]